MFLTTEQIIQMKKLSILVDQYQTTLACLEMARKVLIHEVTQKDGDYTVNLETGEVSDSNAGNV